MNKNQEDINTRIHAIIQHLQMKPAEFSAEIGLNNNATISRIASGKVKPSYEILKKIFLRYPQLNSNWLLTGEGSMMNENFEPNINKTKTEMKEQELIDFLKAENVELKENLKLYREMLRKLQDEKEQLLSTNKDEPKKKEVV